MYNGECTILIKDIKPGLKNINVIFIVLEIGAATVTKENREVRNFKVGDHSACINVSIWDEPGKLIAPGDIIKLTKGYASIWRHCLTLYSGKNGEVYKIGEFCMTFNEQVNMSEPKRSEQQQAPPQALGIVVNPQIMPPSGGGGANAGVGGNNTGGPPVAQQLPATGSNGGAGGNSTTGQQRIITAQLGGTIQQTGAAGAKAANVQVSGTQKAQLAAASAQVAGGGSGQQTTQVGGTGGVTQPQAVKTGRGGRANNTRSGGLKGERR